MVAFDVLARPLPGLALGVSLNSSMHCVWGVWAGGY
jgi:hypothetical protein